MIIKEINDIIDNAKYIQFPINNSWNYKDYYEYNIIKSNIHKLPIIGDDNTMLFTGYPSNEHHFRLYYTYDYVLPLIDNLFNFGYNKNDFYKSKKVIYKNDNEIDLSHYIPKKCNYTIVSLDTNIKYDINDNIYSPRKQDMEYLTRTGMITDFTDYHKLCPLPHSCFKIINNNITNGKKLLISADSQMIPSLIPLSNYYKEIWHFDNRTSPHISLFEFIKGNDFNDILIALYDNPLWKYIETNLN